MNDRQTSLHDIIRNCADSALETQREDGSMPSGHNGPWSDPETPVRTTGHWAITFLRCHEWTGADRFLTAGEKAVSYLTSEEARPHGVTFHHRQSTEKDRCNGLIGQAWSIESLVFAATYLDRPELIDIASDVFTTHPFEEYLAAWHPVEIDGDARPVDMTFNHQLWFAAAGGLLAQHPRSDPVVDEQVRRYLDELPKNLNVTDAGLVYHPFKPDFDVRKYARVFLEGIKAGTAHTMITGVLSDFFSNDEESSETEEGGWTEKSVGYHSFNLYAFALLQEAYPNHAFWNDSKLEETVAYTKRDAYADALDGNPYGYPYNCSGFEIAYALDVLSNIDSEDRRQWLERQLERTYDPETNTLSRNNPDPTTLTARLYEATRVAETDVTLASRDTDD